MCYIQDLYTIPGNIQLILAGYADDTNLIVTDIESLLEINNIITDFELATSSKLNRNKKNEDIWSRAMERPTAVATRLAESRRRSFIHTRYISW